MVTTSVIPSSQHPVPARDLHWARAAIPKLDWEDLRAFLLVIEAGGFRPGAAAGSLSINSLRRRIQNLEQALGIGLLSRTPTGTSPTSAGDLIYAIAREMRVAAELTGCDDDNDILIRPDELRIGCSDGIGALWLTPRLQALQDQISPVSVNLELDLDMKRDRSGDVDIGLSYQRPARNNLVCFKLATLHYMLCASDGYLRSHGTPLSIDEFKGHRFIEQCAPGLKPWIIEHLIGSDQPEGFIPIRSNSSMVIYSSVLAGAGIAALPTYVRSLSNQIIPLDVRLPLRFELWAYYHERARTSRTIRCAVAWLRDAFDPIANPWFGEPFVEPASFAAQGVRSGVRLVDHK